MKIANNIMITKSTSGTISLERMMAATNQIFLMVDTGTPVAAFTARRELQAYRRRLVDTSTRWSVRSGATKARQS
jgi:hypothetical protein